MGYTEQGGIEVLAAEIVFSPLVKRPAVGQAYYRAVVDIRDGHGRMADPDDATVYARLVKTDGTTVAARLCKDGAGVADLAASTLATFLAASGWYEQPVKLSAGRYEMFVEVDTGDTEEPLTLECGFVEQANPLYTDFRFRIGDAADADDLAAVLGTPEAALTDFSGMVGQGDDAAGTAGTAGESLHAKLRALLADTEDMQPKLGTPEVALADLAGMVGQGDDAVGTAGTAGESVHSKLRAILANLGDFAGLTTFLDFLGLFGDLGDPDGIPFMDAFGIGALPMYRVAAAPAPAAGTFTIEALTGGAAVPAVLDTFKLRQAAVLSGASKGQVLLISGYSTAGLVTMPAPVTLTAGDIVVIASAMSSPETATLKDWPIAQDTALSAAPTQNYVDSGQNTDIGTYTVLFQRAIPMPAQGALLSVIKRMMATLLWQTTGVAVGGAGTGLIKWSISDQEETLGAAPAGGVVDITDAVVAAVGTNAYSRSGQVPATAFPSAGPAWLIAQGLVDTATDTLDLGIRTDTEIEYTTGPQF